MKHILRATEHQKHDGLAGAPGTGVWVIVLHGPSVDMQPWAGLGQEQRGWARGGAGAGPAGAGQGISPCSGENSQGTSLSGREHLHLLKFDQF